MNRLEECTGKVNKIRAMLSETGYEGIIIRKQANFSWITAGGRAFIGLASETACAAMVVTAGGVYLAGNNIEVPRLLTEELPQGFVEPVILPWRDDGTMDKTLQQRFGKLSSDTEQDEWFRENRVILQESEAERYAALGRTAAEALEEICASLKPGMTELEGAGKISERLWAEGIEPITLLIAADRRSERVRHYVPTKEKINDGVICSICARSGGLVASATRITAFKKDFARHYQTLLRVEQAAFEATVPGAILGDVFRAIMDAYTENGLKGEWENHHQGGLCGYLAREIRVEPECPKTVRTGQVFAWNPSAAGAKCEDTVFLGEGGLRPLTEVSQQWPAVTINGLRRPLILRL
ncbi:MAG: M24 family metallopeptidase [Spirochaetaceae bacterium]|jgi:Xaa-Pro aminopeptidase|nr:M24 family metallopeptidase [Spirochaetaceae bacterium]